MIDGPIRVDSRSWTGDPVAPSSSYGALEPAGVFQRIWQNPAILMLFVAFGGGLAWQLIDLMIWSIAGEHPYLSWGADRSAFYLAIASGAALAAGLLLTGRRKLLPFMPLAMIGIGGGVSCTSSKRIEPRPGLKRRASTSDRSNCGLGADLPVGARSAPRPIS